jgi:hypothetical protein
MANAIFTPIMPLFTLITKPVCYRNFKKIDAFW